MYMTNRTVPLALSQNNTRVPVVLYDQGKVVCCGSSMFLKRRYGVGYQLTVIKQQVSQSHRCRGAHFTLL